MAYTPENNPYIPGDPYSYDLKWIVEKLKEAIALYEPLNEKFEDLHTFVIDYFNNLDLTSEVSNKINQMALDGSLDALILPYFNEYKNEINGQITEIQNITGNLANDMSVLESRMDEFTNLPDGSTTGDAELADIRIGYNGRTYTTAGDAVRGQAQELQSQINDLPDAMEYAEIIEVKNLESGYYSSVNGTKQDSANYKRSVNLIPAKENTLYISNYATGTDLKAACFDISKTFINYITISPKDEGSRYRRTLMPEGTAWIGLYINDNTITDFSIKEMKYDSIKSIEYPYDDENICYLKETFCSASTGALSSSSTTDVIIIPTPKAGDKWFVSNMAAAQCICLNRSLSVLAATIENIDTITGKMVTIPEGTAFIYFNLYKNNTTGIAGNNHMCDYICKITEKNKILAIGDSLTWLDGRNNYGNMEHFSGWQRQLRLAGYDIRRAGFSGYPYANGLDIVDGIEYSIYKSIVTENYDVLGYDIIILFGGENDVLYGGVLGSRIDTYANRVFDSYTFNGAISGIIDYIRSNNPNAKIIIASFPKSEAASRIFTNAITRVQELEYNSLFWSCKYANIFADMNVSPTYEGFSNLFYDQTHPNFEGMQIIGKLMLNAVQSYK